MKLPVVALLLSTLSLTVQAETADDTAQIKQALSKAIPGLQIHTIQPSEVPGLYAVDSNNPDTLYVTKDGKHFVAGDLYEVQGAGLVNLSEVRKEKERARLLAAVPQSEKVVFKPQDPKAKITVFTDVDCGYCRKLHKEVKRMNELGIEVDYMAYPRAGIGSESYNKMVSVWCSDDPQQSLTQAKNGLTPAPKTCKNPVAAEFNLGNRIGVTGTPAIVLEDGRLIPGYVPADALAKGLGLTN